MQQGSARCRSLGALEIVGKHWNLVSFSCADLCWSEPGLWHRWVATRRPAGRRRNQSLRGAAPDLRFRRFFGFGNMMKYMWICFSAKHPFIKLRKGRVQLHFGPCLDKQSCKLLQGISQFMAMLIQFMLVSRMPRKCWQMGPGAGFELCLCSLVAAGEMQYDMIDPFYENIWGTRFFNFPLYLGRAYTRSTMVYTCLHFVRVCSIVGLWAPVDVSLIICHAARGAAYGVSQASPSGGINAVWVMPEAGGGFLAEDRTGNQRLSPSFPWFCCFYMTQYGKTMHIIYILLLCLHTDRHAPLLSYNLM